MSKRTKYEEALDYLPKLAENPEEEKKFLAELHRTAKRQAKKAGQENNPFMNGDIFRW